MAMPTKAETKRRKREATVYDEAPSNECECCGEEKDTAQDNETYAWVCTRCYWTMPRN